ncbi:acetyl-CoA C-acetyltransferase [Zhongshania aquimaris]|uniref:Acetyl-CoA C-acetyltransferase n=1 Tax=Zhongshania aquimaris TaxID=2857107 RepID=A0ABS6VNK2_9GAMM|nr:acetyl-CoA C-acetyltransferase [Zhongshania aquimaris]MBW2939902.1 acetyl-CoA C-acetyltransferase [Zhongshania aquimaris]
MTEAWIIDACRTPRGIGKSGKGSLAHVHPHRIGSAVLSAIRDRNNINTADVDDVIWGTSAQGGAQAGDIGRMTALDAGYDIKSSGVTLDRFCGSGLTAVNFAAASVMSGMEDLVVAGGSEKMSAPDRMAGRLPSMDQGNLHLRYLHPQIHQGMCADAIASIEHINRMSLDQFALRSQQRAAHAQINGYFNKSLIPVYNEDGSLALAHDEHPRHGTTLEALSQLAPSFDNLDLSIDGSGDTYRRLLAIKYPGLEIPHVHHAGNSSGVVDGAAAVLFASPEYATRNRLAPRARVVAVANMGGCPTLMLNAPVNSVEKVLLKARLQIDDIDLFEINEAFAVVVEKCIRDLKLDPEKVNVNGGAIALGHPIGATGVMLIGTLLDELERRDMRYGLVTLCAGGGMAPAMIIERL